MKIMNAVGLVSMILIFAFEEAHGYNIPSVEDTTAITAHNGIVEYPQYEDVNGFEEDGRNKREIVEYDREVVYSPYYGHGYYIFPRTFHEERYEREHIPKRRSYTRHQKRKKLFVPNLFG